jgi:hypothetical protein
MNTYAQLNELFNISNLEERKQIIKTLRELIKDFELNIKVKK